MAPKLAHKRYMTLMLGSSFGYVITLLGITYFLKQSNEVSPLTIGLGLVPGLFVTGMLYSIWRYLKEIDEAARFFMSRSLLLASFVVLTIAGVWGILEMLLDDLQKIPVFWIFPIFFFVFGAVTVLGSNRDAGCA